MIQWHRRIREHRTLVLATIGVAGIGAASHVAAFPLEKFDHQVEVSCASSASCARSLRAKTSLGAYTGILIRGGTDMTSSFSAKQGVFEVKASGTSLGTILLSWDSDTYADQLSSSGLKCVDMRLQGGSAIVLKDFLISGTCGDGNLECPPFVIETRVYDAADPTGQTYSASVLRRANGRERGDLLIPFSNFTRKGLRGEGRMECAGAVSISIRADEYSALTLQVGPIFTNSEQPLEALVFTPTPTAPPATPTNESVVSATATPTVIFTPTIGATPTILPARTVTPELMVTPDATQPPTLGKVVVAPLGTAEVEPERAPEESVYGQIINE